MLRSVADLVGYLEKGNSVKYVFFWGHTQRGQRINESCLSQWYDSGFGVEPHWFPTAEHFMMHRKAILFDDHTTAEKILLAESPGEAKALGREVKDFDLAAWIESRWEIVVSANFEKFRQNDSLREFLLNTGERVLVEASPVDAIWGIGLDKVAALHMHPRDWPGTNHLGFALMEVRDRLRTTAV